MERREWVWRMLTYRRTFPWTAPAEAMGHASEVQVPDGPAVCRLQAVVNGHVRGWY